jgi:hypothetical protein
MLLAVAEERLPGKIGAALRQQHKDILCSTQGAVGRKPGTPSETPEGKWWRRGKSSCAERHSLNLLSSSFVTLSGHGQIHLGQCVDWPPPQCRVEGAYFPGRHWRSTASPCMLSLNAASWPSRQLPGRVPGHCDGEESWLCSELLISWNSSLPVLDGIVSSRLFAGIYREMNTNSPNPQLCTGQRHLHRHQG